MRSNAARPLISFRPSLVETMSTPLPPGGRRKPPESSLRNSAESAPWAFANSSFFIRRPQAITFNHMSLPSSHAGKPGSPAAPNTAMVSAGLSWRDLQAHARVTVDDMILGGGAVEIQIVGILTIEFAVSAIFSTRRRWWRTRHYASAWLEIGDRRRRHWRSRRTSASGENGYGG